MSNKEGAGEDEQTPAHEAIGKEDQNPPTNMETSNSKCVSQENQSPCRETTEKEAKKEAEAPKEADAEKTKEALKEVEAKKGVESREKEVEAKKGVESREKEAEAKKAAESREKEAEAKKAAESREKEAESKKAVESREKEAEAKKAAEVKQQAEVKKEAVAKEAAETKEIAEVKEEVAEKMEEAEVKEMDVKEDMEEMVVDEVVDEEAEVVDEKMEEEEEEDEEEEELQSRSEAGSVSGEESPVGSPQSCTSPVPQEETKSPSKSRSQKSFGIKVINLPPRPTDSSMKSGLFHEFKKYGRITSVQIRRTSEDRFGLVFFRLQDDQEKALASIKGKNFYGTQIQASAWTGPEPDCEEEGKLLGDGLNPLHYRASRSLFVSNLEKSTKSSDLRELFQRFGDIMKIEIKSNRGIPQYGFVLFSDITSVCSAIKEMDGHYLGSNRLKLGFGKSRPTNCLWLDGLPEEVSKEVLEQHFSRFGPVVEVVLDKVKHRALVLFLKTAHCIVALKKTKYWKPHGQRVMVDYSTQSGQLFFYHCMKKSGQDIGDLNDISEEEEEGDSGSIIDEESSDKEVQSPAAPASPEPAAEPEAPKENSEPNTSSETKVEDIPPQSSDTEKEDKTSKPHKQLDGFHVRATRSLFVRSLTTNVMRVRELRELFSRFGEIEEIELKYVRGVAMYAFLQFSDITSVCNAINEMDGTNGLKLGFGKSRPTNYVWLDGLSKETTKEYLKQHFSRYGPVVEVVLNKLKARAMILFVETEDAKRAVRETKKRKIDGKKVMVDFMNLKSQVAFYKAMEASEQDIGDGDASGEDKVRGEKSPAKSVQSPSAPTSPAPPSEPKPAAEDDESHKSFGIKVENLPSRSTDSGVKDGLFHEFKKYGKIIAVQISGTGDERYGLVLFRHKEDQEKALVSLQGKELFGSQIKLTESSVVPVTKKVSDDQLPDERIDPFHPGATCSLCVRNLESTTRSGHLRQLFEEFGEILDVNIILKRGVAQYAILLFSDILSVCKAIKKMDGYSLGSNRLKLSFGRSKPTTCVWLDGLALDVTTKYLMKYFSRYGPVVEVVLDDLQGKAMILFVETEDAVKALKETKYRRVGGRRVMCDFASQNLRMAFYHSMEASGQDIGHFSTLLEDGREERRGAFREYSPDRGHYDPIRGPPSYREDFRFEHRARSRDFYPELDLYPSDYHGSRYFDDRRKYKEHRRGFYENIPEHGDRQRGRKRKHEWVESFPNRDHFRRAIRRSHSPARSRLSLRTTV